MPADTPTPDPMRELRLPLTPIAPRPEFAASLRRRVEAELAGSDRTIDVPERSTAMSPTTTSTTSTTAPSAANSSGHPALIPYLCAADASAALDFYAEAFGAVERMRMVDDTGRLGHAEFTIGDVVFYLADEHPEYGVLSPSTLGGSPVSLQLLVDDVDTSYARAVSAGATGERPPSDQFHGNRNATLRDPFGHRWSLTRPVEQLTAEELAARAPEYETTYAPSTTPAASGPAGSPPIEVGYYVLGTPDVDRAAAFYGALFGWTAEPAADSATGHRYRHVSNVKLPMGLHDDPDDVSPHLYFRVDDLPAMVAKVRELGGTVVEVTDYASGGNAECIDDQGTHFSLWKPAPGYE
jgi:uncharacterized glyoxalase superfamily protein PhnB